MTLVIKGIDEKKLREFKAKAILRGLTLREALEEAMEMWCNSAVLGSEEDLNNAAYLRFKKHLKRYKGMYVVFTHGKFVGAFERLEDVTKALKELKPRPKHALVLKVGVDKKVEGELEWWGGSIELVRA